MQRKRLKEILSGFKSCRIAVLGDVMLDEFLWGKVDRISPEAPVPVVQIKKETWRPGGAANVASNIVSLGAKAVVFGLIGDDGAGRRLKESLEAEGIAFDGLVVDSGRRTTVKTRIIGQNQQMIRIDREHTEPVDHNTGTMMASTLWKMLPELDGIIISDYAKGVIREELLKLLIEKFKNAGKFVAIDPKLKNFPLYSRATIITPNTREAESVLGVIFETEDDVMAGGIELMKRFKTDAVLITRGEHGMSLFRKGEQPVTIPTRAVEVFDVTGAGDTVIATFSLALAAGCSMVEAAETANLAAGVVVGILGTATAKPDNLVEHLDRIQFERISKNE